MLAAFFPAIGDVENLVQAGVIKQLVQPCSDGDEACRKFASFAVGMAPGGCRVQVILSLFHNQSATNIYTVYVSSWVFQIGCAC